MEAMTTPFTPSNSDDIMGFIELHCMKCCHEEYARDPEADGERCPILTEIILGRDRPEVTEDNGITRCSKWAPWIGVHVPIEVTDPNQTSLDL